MLPSCKHALAACLLVHFTRVHQVHLSPLFHTGSAPGLLTTCKLASLIHFRSMNEETNDVIMVFLFIMTGNDFLNSTTCNRYALVIGADMGFGTVLKILISNSN